MMRQVLLALCCLVLPLACSGNAVPEAEAPPSTIELNTTTVPTTVSLMGMVFRDGAFTVVWSGYGAEDTERQLFTARVSPAGEIVVPAGNRGTLPDFNWHASVLATPDGHAVWYRGPNNDEIWALLLDAHARDVVVPPAFVLDGDTPNVDFRDGQFNVAFQYGSPRQVQLQSFAPDLASLGPPVPFETSTLTQYAARLAWVESASAYLVTWTEDPWGSQPEMRRMMADPSSSIWPASVRLYDPPSSMRYPGALVDARDNVLFRWRSEHGAHLFSYESIDSPIWEAPILLFSRNRAESLDFAWDHLGEEVLMAWQDDSESALPLVSAGMFAPAAGEQELRRVELGADPAHLHETPVVAAGAGLFAVAWASYFDGAGHILFETVQP